MVLAIYITTPTINLELAMHSVTEVCHLVLYQLLWAPYNCTDVAPLSPNHHSSSLKGWYTHFKGWYNHFGGNSPTNADNEMKCYLNIPIS